ncbi:MAG TPA: hypothetical protein VHK67_05905 [Rhabdochlamydiaceae bacterium]|nr:hypothetical protein [Rhabdochlamydiaceae bacterium]
MLQSENHWSEVSPLPGRSQESLHQVLQQLKAIQNGYQGPLFPSVEFGLFGLSGPKIIDAPVCLYLNGTVQDILKHAKTNHGCKVAKLKVSHLDVPAAVFLARLLKNEFRLRLDIVGMWSKEQTTQFLANFSPEDFEFIEDPGCDISPFPMASDHQNLGSMTVWKPMVKGLPPKKSAVIRFPVKSWSYGKESALNLSQTEPAPKQLNLNKLSDAGGLKESGWTTQPDPQLLTGNRIILSSSHESGIGIHQIASLSQALEIPSHPLGIGTVLYIQEDLLKDPPFIREGKIHFPTEFHIKKEKVTPC